MGEVIWEQVNEAGVVVNHLVELLIIKEYRLNFYASA